MGQANCLDLDPEVGDIELLEELNQHFGLQPSQEQCRHWRTLGDIHDTLQDVLGTRSEGACPSLRAFNGLRQAVLAGGRARSALGPSTPLDALDNHRPRQWLQRLATQTGFDMPWCRYGPTGQGGSWLFLVGFVFGIVLLGAGQWRAGLGLLAMMALGLWLMWRDHGRWPAGLATLGDLADRVAALNHRKLGDVRDLPGTRWRRLTAIAAEQSDMAPADMQADTLLFAPRRTQLLCRRKRSFTDG